jgi:hypothetical protein
MQAEEKQVSIYALSDPRKRTLIRYVGKTCLSLKTRLNQHINERNRRHTPKNCWIQKLHSEGVKPLIWVIENCPESIWEQRERYWISLFKGLDGFLNVSDGGNTGPDMRGYVHTAETRAKISKAGMGRKQHSRVGSDKLKVYWRTHKMTNEHREAIRVGLEKSNHWVFASAKAREVNLGKKRPTEVVQRARLAMMSSPKFLKRLRPIVNTKTGIIYSCVEDASKKTGMSMPKIRKHLYVKYVKNREWIRKST